MAAETFSIAQKRVLVHEGGYSNHPQDPGGVTLEGITQRVYNAYRRRKGRPVKALTREMRGTEAWQSERDEIYREQYWDAVKGDQLPEGVDYAVYDGAVNSGPVQSIKWLQRALGVKADGHIGEATLEACAAHPDPDLLVKAICAKRRAFLRALKTWHVFGKGWSARVNDVERASNALAIGSIPAEPRYAELANAKATVSSAKPIPQTGTADVTAGVGTASTTITQTTEAIAPVADSSETLALIYSILTILGVSLLVGGVLWGLYARKKRKELQDALDITPEPEPLDTAEADA